MDGKRSDILSAIESKKCVERIDQYIKKIDKAGLVLDLDTNKTQMIETNALMNIPNLILLPQKMFKQQHSWQLACVLLSIKIYVSMQHSSKHIILVSSHQINCRFIYIDAYLNATMREHSPNH
jgi:hypothetical protein